MEGITSFTTAPLKISSYLGFATALGALVAGLYFMTKAMIFGDPVAGFPTLITVMLFLGGVQLAVLGVIGEYLGRIFNETKSRPLYFATMHLPSSIVEATAKPAPKAEPVQRATATRPVSAVKATGTGHRVVVSVGSHSM